MSARSGILPENALTSFHRNTNSVRVDNVSKRSTSEIIALFNALVGQIRSFHEIKDALGTHLEITFFSRDAAAKALCMTGYNIGGAFLAVTPITTHLPNSRMRSSVDDRRNLYVLGLPFALTKNEFAALFSPFGTVSHCVILATVDNSSRRRGFIVMSTHEEAKRAMSELTRTQIKCVLSSVTDFMKPTIPVRGHTIDVSWAVVQRSQGFLDGGDRAMLLDSRNASIPGNENNDHHANEMPNKVSCPMDSDLGSYTPSFDPTTTLLVSKLPAVLFSQTQDLEPLFYPYGPLKKLQVIGAPLNGTLSVLVQYLSVSAAQEAKEALHGQNYINYQIEAQFLRSVTSPLDLVQASCVISPPGAGNKLETPSPVAFDAIRAYRQPESYGSTRIPGNLTDLSKRPLRATPNFTLAFHDRNSSEITPVSAQWGTNTNSYQHPGNQRPTVNHFFSSNQYRNLLA